MSGRAAPGAAEAAQPRASSPEIGRRDLLSRRGLIALLASCVPPAPRLSPRALARQRALAELEARRAREAAPPGEGETGVTLGGDRPRERCW